ncbi:MAG: heparinase II/III domain-containing protein [Limnochordia bacterium]
MISRLSVLTLLLVLVSTMTVAHSSSLIPNGDFEQLGAGRLPAGFSTWAGQGSPEFALDSDHAYSGQHSVRITGDGDDRGSFNVTLPWESGTYKATIRYKISPEMAAEAVVLRMMAFHSAGSAETDKIGWNINRIAPGPGATALPQGRNLHVVPLKESADEEWDLLEVVFTVPDEVVRIQFNLFNWLGTGTVWFDDFRIESTSFDWDTYQVTRYERELQSLGGLSMVINLRQEHPRLLMTQDDVPRLRALIADDAQARGWYTALKSNATSLLFQPPSQYEIPDGIRLLATSRRVLDRVMLLSFVHLIEGDMRFAERAWRELEAAAQFPDWNPSHFLDTAEMTNAFAIGYDWLYHVWTPEQRTVLREAIISMGLEAGLNAYRSNASWVRATHNWNLVCNGGLAMGALAIADEEPAIAELILQAGIKSVPNAITQFAPDGGWNEGVGYWHYSIRYLIPYIAALESALDDSCGLSDTPGLDLAGTFPVYLTSPAGMAFNFSDSGTGVVNSPEMFWMARRYGQPGYAWWQHRMSRDRASVLGLLWYSRDLIEEFDHATLPLDRHFRHVEVATMRSDWEDKEALFVGFIAGDNKANHGDLHMGQFVLDALGQRWAIDLGSEDYNIPGYWGTQRWTYYRKRAEGHNTLVINPSKDVDQDPRAVSHIVFQGSDESEAVCIADLTPGYQQHARSFKRGIALMDERSQVLVQDELETLQPAEVWWFMHTRADITVDGDGRVALLEQGGKRMAVRILSPAGASFTVLSAVPLPTSPNPLGQNPNENVQKLAIHLPEVTDVRITVQFTPLQDHELGSAAPEILPLQMWQESMAAGHRLWSPLERTKLSVSLPKEPARGVVSIPMAWDLPALSRVEEVRISVDDEVVYREDRPPEEIVFDTLSVVDGSHRLVVDAVIDGVPARREYPFRVANWWRIVDRMEPPIDTGWFGTLIRSLTSSESDGWAYTAAESSRQLGGVDRRIRVQDTEEYLIWEAPHLRSVRILVHAPKTTVEPALRLLVSQDGETWDAVAFTTHERETSPDRLYTLAVEAEVAPTADVQWFQLCLLPGHFAPDELQISQAELTGLNR